MKRIHVKIRGVAPLLQHRFPIEEHGAEASKKKQKVYRPEDDAKKALYYNDEIGIYQPSEHILAAMIKAGTSFKFEGKRTFKDIVAAGIAVEPECISMNRGLDEYTIDLRPVVIQRARVVRARPRFDVWELVFDVLILDDENISAPTIKDILEKAGTLGIGDYRPRFGRFQVVSFDEVQA